MVDQSKDNIATHPDFDGHVEYALSEMTVAQRLDWLDQTRDLLIATGVIVTPIDPITRSTDPIS